MVWPRGDGPADQGSTVLPVGERGEEKPLGQWKALPVETHEIVPGSFKGQKLLPLQDLQVGEP
ncbi:hypothetical protein MPNT_460012 [Candidatus Methylacidithermus pantelleriae]|uniref:Uncharacterized protein n=1 Tax=Candidatus Methylacidithermus pantelleriae TaxID=2744239 RepID=A0A8J2FWY8_9BACT|nr:hypothetical protein MPNT_460012 [Candidatus Methylacidithermus pantelleriae]